ncbi:hypothetical protein ED312_06650 [Sinomicrobium pectinilyticum]|uniref:Methylamine utilisation protein MauE domain-containing protein n=2 Tax=Sinomicrobium pectinilyticum TaxID=1084421 RepID=A0A3N0EQX9_SINP1|nr:hypothetical protein ED312_06650 [Sinomicrobium pectinilyticum]
MKPVLISIKRFTHQNRHIIVEIICLLYIILFVYAAFTKLIDYEKFQIQVGQSPIFTSIGGLIAWIIPTIELLIAFMLIIPRLRLLALYACFSLMAMFTAYIYIILNFSPFVPCSCGGILEKMGWTEHLVFNIAFVFLAIIGVLLHSPERNEQSSVARKSFKQFLFNTK